MIRAFIAIVLPESVMERLRIEVNVVRKLESGIRWIKPENIHLTLKFLGDIPGDRVSEIVKTVERSVKGKTAFQLSIQGTGAFPNCKRPKVLWAGINQGKHEIIKLATDIDVALSGLGFQKEKRQFSPHITVGRLKYFKNIDKVITQFKQLFTQDEAMLVENIQLIKSTLKPSGAEYTPLHVIQLKDGGK